MDRGQTHLTFSPEFTKAVESKQVGTGADVGGRAGGRCEAPASVLAWPFS